MKLNGLTAVLVLASLDLSGAALMAAASKGESQSLSWSLVNEPWTGDYDGMVKHVLDGGFASFAKSGWRPMETVRDAKMRARKEFR